MDPTATVLRDSFVVAYRPYVENRLAELRLASPDGLDRAVVEGQAWLAETLTELLSQPPDAQRRGPLEVFQEAMRFPAEALQEAGIEPTERDPVSANALPGDLYDLAPASSAGLGDEAWQAHLAWGTGKAAAVTNPARPQVAIATRNLMDRSRIENAARSQGWETVKWPSESGKPALAVVDLESPDADEAIAALSESKVRVIAYGPHVDDIALARARSLGAGEALPRSRFFSGLDQLFPPIA